MNFKPLNFDSASQFIKEVRRITSPGTYNTFISLIENRYSSIQKVNFGFQKEGSEILYSNAK